MIAIKLTQCQYAVLFDILSFGTKCFNESVPTSFWLTMASNAQNSSGVWPFFLCTEQSEKIKTVIPGHYYNSGQRSIVI